MQKNVRKKPYTDGQLQDVMNNHSFSDVISFVGSESENEEDNLKSDTIDDSDNDKHYEHSTSSDEGIEEYDEVEYLRRASKRQRSIMPPPAVASAAAANDESASPTLGTSALSAVPAVAWGQKGSVDLFGVLQNLRLLLPMMNLLLTLMILLFLLMTMVTVMFQESSILEKVK